MGTVFRVKVLDPAFHIQGPGSQVKGPWWRVPGRRSHIKIPGPGLRLWVLGARSKVNSLRQRVPGPIYVSRIPSLGPGSHFLALCEAFTPVVFYSIEELQQSIAPHIIILTIIGKLTIYQKMPIYTSKFLTTLFEDGLFLENFQVNVFKSLTKMTSEIKRKKYADLMNSKRLVSNHNSFKGVTRL